MNTSEHAKAFLPILKYGGYELGYSCARLWCMYTFLPIGGGLVGSGGGELFGKGGGISSTSAPIFWEFLAYAEPLNSTGGVNRSSICSSISPSNLSV